MLTLKFLGAAETVTGSKFYLSDEKTNILIDCGLFQGLKELRIRNRNPFPIPPASIDYCILTHAHIDHSGYLPCLIKEGFRGKVFTTPSTSDLLKIMLPDSAHLQEEEAKYANKKGFSKHKPALPLYTVNEAYESLKYIEPINYNKEISLSSNCSFKFYDAGHLLGSAFIEIKFKKGFGSQKLLFTGDLGRYNMPILKNPTTIVDADYLILESTYGNRIHSHISIYETLEYVINESIKRGGCLLIPSFAIGRTQEILYVIRELQEKKRILENIEVHIDSPMAIEATEIFLRHPEDHDLETQAMEKGGKSPLKCDNFHINRSVEESKSLNLLTKNAVIISADGMCTGGRILHHLYNRISNPKTTILFVGFQAIGTRGRSILDGAPKVKIFGESLMVNAKIISIDSFSCHADYFESVQWLKNFKNPPKKIFLVHGEPDACQSLSEKIKENLNWNAHIPKLEEELRLD
ncbi:MAG: MBL fold metallo-hydrolase [Armatimonadetes bacterium]|nr:MBL fold metallo-hydrolase [Armatimonadota bacterium]